MNMPITRHRLSIPYGLLAASLPSIHPYPEGQLPIEYKIRLTLYRLILDKAKVY